MYTQKEIKKALSTYDKFKNQRKTIKYLGYPSRYQLRIWLTKRAKGEGITCWKTNKATSNRTHRCLSLDTKLKAIKRLLAKEISQINLAMEIGVHERTIYTWKRKYLEEGILGLMSKHSKKKKNSKKNQTKRKLDLEIKESKENTNEDQTYDELRREVEDLRFELDVMKEIINVIKKDPRVDLCKLKNTEKVVIVDALKERYSLPKMLKELKLPKSSYYYHVNYKSKEDKHKELRMKICTIFEDNHSCYGYRRIRAVLLRDKIKVSEKVIRRLMREENLKVKKNQTVRYSSFKGDFDPTVPNLVKRDFRAEIPNNKWFTDLSEFSIPAGKIYLSPIMDGFDGMITSWSTSTIPNAKLVNSSLEQALKFLNEGDNPLIHSDRGIHYFWTKWVELIEKNKLRRSMSKKGCSPDNAAMEGFFGTLKTECFYGRDFKGYTIKEFTKYIDNYIVWYNTKRIKQSLGYKSPLEYRKDLGYAA